MGLLSTIFGSQRGVPPFAAAPLDSSGSEAPTTPETMPVKRGLAGFFDRLAYPTNALGQIGQALLAGGGGPLGNAAALLMQQGANRNKRQYEHIGNSFGYVDQATGKFIPTYTAPDAPTAPHYWESNDGSLHAIGDDGKPVEVYHDPTPKMNFIPDGMGGGRWVAVPGTGASAPTAPVGTVTPIPDPAPANEPPAGGTSAKGIIGRNNPGALRIPGSLGFQSFSTPQAGIAAQESQLGRYFGRGLRSVADVVETYAPRASKGGDNTDAQVNNYIAYVSRRLGVNPQDTLSDAMLPKLGEAMREFETGRRAF